MKKICVLGIGKTGIAVANLALNLGYNVFASDNKIVDIKKINKKIDFELGTHSNKILDCDLIIKSPGINNNIPILKKARKLNIKIISELYFSIKYSKFKNIIAITGTNGKTTTTDLIANISKYAKIDFVVSGNIGIPLAEKALKTTKNTSIILEVSSYQLEDTIKFKPNISVLLNIAYDHLDHHKNIESYINVKKKIFLHQDYNDISIINYDDKICKKISKEIKSKVFFFSKHILKEGVYYKNKKIFIKINKKTITIKPKINIIGKHNIENILAAVTTAYVLKIHPKIIEKTISNYNGVEHRIEFVRTLFGVNYYNDSKSTNIDSTKVAIKSFSSKVLLIMGGHDKGFDYGTLKTVIKKKVKAIFLIGDASKKIKKDLLNTTLFFECITIENAILKILKFAISGDIVLFSPGCSSFDQFYNFEERGKIFKKIINNL
jgi:UDP-N-acetylmuramoylalanine--D-glutamate ligase